MILIVDNYDSFVYNLARYVSLLGHATHVLRNDDPALQDVDPRTVDAIVLSPGPCAPDQAGMSLELVRRWRGRVPLLGVCLGHQTIIQACGGRIVAASSPTHGAASEVFHDGRHEFQGIARPVWAGRYHSLVGDPAAVPDGLEVSARLADGTIMAVRGTASSGAAPLAGWQFHPESILTPEGFNLLRGFLRWANLSADGQHTYRDELTQPATKEWVGPSQPVTF